MNLTEKLIFGLIYAFLILRTLNLNVPVNASTIRSLYVKSKLSNHIYSSSYLPMTSSEQFKKLKRNEFVDFEQSNLEPNGNCLFCTTNLNLIFQWNSINDIKWPLFVWKTDDEDSLNQTRITAEELINKKKKEILVSQQILLVLCFGFIILIVAISKIIMNMGQSIDNRKYLLVQY